MRIVNNIKKVGILIFLTAILLGVPSVQAHVFCPDGRFVPTPSDCPAYNMGNADNKSASQSTLTTTTIKSIPLTTEQEAKVIFSFVGILIIGIVFVYLIRHQLPGYS